MTEDDTPPSGIKSFSVGLGDGTQIPRDREPPPPYRVLIVGDFAAQTGTVHEISGLDIAGVLELLAPSLTVQADNLLGSLPAQLSEEFSFRRPRDLKPDALLSGMGYRATVKTALAHGPRGLADFGQQFDRLAEAAAQGSNTSPALQYGASDGRQTRPQQDTTPTPPSAQAVDPADDTGKDGDGLDGLFSMVDAPRPAADSPVTQDLAKHAVEAFLSQTVGRQSQRPETTQTENQTKAPPVEDLLARQDALFLQDSRLRQVIANWMSLRMLLAEQPRGTSIRLFLTQLDHGAASSQTAQALGEPDGALARAAFDLVLAANSTGLGNKDAAHLKDLAALAAENATCLFANVQPEFAGLSAEDIGQRDAPHQVLEAPGFEQFASLRRSSSASNLALFWNEGRLFSSPQSARTLGIPAGWFAVLSVLQAQATDAWPGLTIGKRLLVDLLETDERQVRGRTIADSVVNHVTKEAAGSLATAGINALFGQANRAEVYFSAARTLAEATTDHPDARVTGVLSLARLNTLLQIAFSRAQAGCTNAQEAAEELQTRLDDISDGLNGRVTFTVAPEKDGDDDVLDIDAVVAGLGSAGSSFSFRIGI